MTNRPISAAPEAYVAEIVAFATLPRWLRRVSVGLAWAGAASFAVTFLLAEYLSQARLGLWRLPAFCFCHTLPVTQLGTELVSFMIWLTLALFALPVVVCVMGGQVASWHDPDRGHAERVLRPTDAA